MTERQALAALYSFTYFGPARTKLIVEYFGSASDAWRAGREQLVKIGITSKKVEEFLQYKQSFNERKYFETLEKLEINFLTYKDSTYPTNLKDLNNAPSVLYVRGNLETSDLNAVAIVGTRKMTAYGREVTKIFAGELATYGVTIISGLALGVDACAHKACLDAGGRTIAVLASGLDLITPASNTQLSKHIVEKGGAIVSEYPLGYPPFRTNFPSRNRIISGLSVAVLVVEGAAKSGTLLTASSAAEQGKTVFAVPGQITSPMSAAPHFLIENGAKVATGPKDILDELNMQFRVDGTMVRKVVPASKEEETLIEIIANEPLHLDEIARISSLELSGVSARLTIMELKGLVKNLGGGVYKKV